MQKDHRATVPGDLFDVKIRKKTFHSEKGMQKSVGTVF